MLGLASRLGQYTTCFWTLGIMKRTFMMMFLQCLLFMYVYIFLFLLQVFLIYTVDRSIILMTDRSQCCPTYANLKLTYPINYC